MATSIKDSLTADPSKSQIFFKIKGLPEDAVAVLSYDSENQTLSTDFKYHIVVFSKEIIQPEQVIGKKATLITKRGDDDIRVHGIIATMEFVRSLLGGFETTLLLKSPLTILNHFVNSSCKCNS